MLLAAVLLLLALARPSAAGLGVRYVRVTSAFPTDILNFGELKVFNSAGVNVALNRPTSMSSIFSAAGEPFCGTTVDFASDGVDGNLCTYAATDYGSNQGSVAQWWQVDLGSTRTDLASIAFYVRNDNVFGTTSWAYRANSAVISFLDASGTQVIASFSLPSNVVTLPIPFTQSLASYLPPARVADPAMQCSAGYYPAAFTCPLSWIPTTSASCFKGYLSGGGGLTFMQANMQCAQQGVNGGLAAIHAGDWPALLAVLPAAAEIWLGASSIGEAQPSSFVNMRTGDSAVAGAANHWSYGQPDNWGGSSTYFNEPCVEIHGSTNTQTWPLTLNDLSCSSSLPGYVCEIDATAACALCPQNTYSAAGATSCSPCPLGFMSGSGASACEAVPSSSPTATRTPSPSGTISVTSAASASSTSVASLTSSLTPSPTATTSPSSTISVTIAASASSTSVASLTSSLTPSPTPTPSPSCTVSASLSSVASASLSTAASASSSPASSLASSPTVSQSSAASATSSGATPKPSTSTTPSTTPSASALPVEQQPDELLFSLRFPPSAPAAGAMSRLRASPPLLALLRKGIADLLYVDVSDVRIVEAVDPVYGTFIFPASVAPVAAPAAAAASPSAHLRALQPAVAVVSDVVVIGVLAVSSQAAAPGGAALYAGISQSEIATDMRTILVSAFGANSDEPMALAPFAAAYGAGAPASIELLAFRMPSLPPPKAAAAADASAVPWYATPLSAGLLGLGAAALAALAAVSAATVVRWVQGRVAPYCAEPVLNPQVLLTLRRPKGDPL